MNTEDVWRAIDDQRQRLVALLESLSKEEWQRPSLCQGWTIRDVAAHVALQNTTWSALPKAVRIAIREGGLNPAIAAIAREHAQLPTDQIIGEIRDRIGVWRPLPLVTYRESAIDYLVHPQDIAIPLGRELAMPSDAAVAAVDRVWSSDRMFHARKRYPGYRFIATDADWVVGEGAEVSGPVGGLLLLLTWRPAGLTSLSGPGADAIRTGHRTATSQ